MSKFKIVLIYKLADPIGEEMLAKKGDIFIPSSDKPEAIRAALVDADAIVMRGPAILPGDLIAGANKLKVIASSGSGTDYIDVEAATRRGIPVVYGAGVAPRAVAEYVLGAMVAAHRGFLGLHNRLNTKPIDWVKRVAELRGVELTGTTLGIIGFGAIGQTLARIARGAFDVKILAYDPHLPPEVGADLAHRVGDLKELLEASLSVAVHVPLQPSTRGLLRREHFRLIGPSGILVNASRGGVVDESDLVAALKAGELKAAVMDVFDNEPPTADQIARLSAAPNMLLTPHIAGATDQAFAALSRNVAEGVIAVLEGRRPPLVVNPQVFSA